jgi:pimeloyl-ACP methyl ester carboxylesterase
VTERLQPTAKNVTVNGLRLRYLEWGRPDALPVVCVHGYTSSAEAFNALARRIQDRAHVIAMDVRGHGESAWSPDSAYQYADQAGDLGALVDRLGLDRFLLIGTSMGGVISMVYAMQHAGRLRGLVLNDIGPDVEAGSSRITGLVRARPADFASLEEAMQHRRETSPITASRPLADQEETARGVVRERPDGRWVWKMDPAYIEQRIKQGPPKRPALWPVLETLPCLKPSIIA